MSEVEGRGLEPPGQHPRAGEQGTVCHLSQGQAKDDRWYDKRSRPGQYPPQHTGEFAVPDWFGCGDVYGALQGIGRE
jgi:hypothetical protein